MDKRYTVVTDSNLNDLVIKVNKLLKEGWTLQGGIATVLHPCGDITYLQALAWNA